MNKICTDISQSQKLIELGVDTHTADMCYINGKPNIGFLSEEYEYFGNNVLTYYWPAWSFTALLELIPPYLGEFKDGIDFGFSKAMNGKWYSAHYIKFDDNGLASFNKTVTGDTAIDAAFEIVCWLKENGKI